MVAENGAKVAKNGTFTLRDSHFFNRFRRDDKSDSVIVVLLVAQKKRSYYPLLNSNIVVRIFVCLQTTIICKVVFIVVFTNDYLLYSHLYITTIQTTILYYTTTNSRWFWTSIKATVKTTIQSMTIKAVIKTIIYRKVAYFIVVKIVIVAKFAPNDCAFFVVSWKKTTIKATVFLISSFFSMILLKKRQSLKSPGLMSNLWFYGNLNFLKKGRGSSKHS